MNEYRKELVQVAAVAAAMLEDEDFGQANFWSAPNYNLPSESHGSMALSAIARERIAQDGKWGPQHHDRFTWLVILMEEVGELAEELIDEDMPDDFDALDEGFGWEVVFRTAEAGRKAKRWLERRFD